VVSIDQVAEVNLGHPSQVRLRNGDVLFVTSASKAALLTFIHQTDAKVEHRRSVWSALLNPFLDTWEEQETIDREFAWFATLGLARDAVDAWRIEVAPAMAAYNFGTHLWEWTSLTLHDVLRAQHACLA